MGCVYMATNIKTNMSYIGKTIKSMNIRRKEHYRLSHTLKNTYFSRVLSSSLEEDFEWVVLFSDNNERKLFSVERKMISYYNTVAPNGYNLTLGGEGGTFPPELKKVLSIMWKNKYKNDMEYVRKRQEGINKFWESDEAKVFAKEKAIKLAQNPKWIKGNRDSWTVERRKKAANIMKDRMNVYKENDMGWFANRNKGHMSMETRQQLSEKGKNRFSNKEYLEEHRRKIQDICNTEEWRNHNIPLWESHKKPVICIETDEYFSCANDAAIKINSTRRNVNAVLNKKQKTTRGWKFRYATLEEISTYKERNL